MNLNTCSAYLDLNLNLNFLYSISKNNYHTRPRAHFCRIKSNLILKRYYSQELELGKCWKINGFSFNASSCQGLSSSKQTILKLTNCLRFSRKNIMLWGKKLTFTSEYNKIFMKRRFQRISLRLLVNIPLSKLRNS